MGLPQIIEVMDHDFGLKPMVTGSSMFFSKPRAQSEGPASPTDHWQR